MGATGIGLSVAHGIASSYGGLLELVESEEKKGSTFRLTIPVFVGNGKNPEAITGRESPLTAPGLTLAGLSVLIADDEQIYRNLLEDILTELGVRTESAVSGEEAVRANDLKKYDIIFLDYLMPGMGGIEAATSLRTRGYSGAIIIISGRTILPSLKNALEIQRADYLAKPFEISEVRELLQRISRRQQTTPE